MDSTYDDAVITVAMPRARWTQDEVEKVYHREMPGAKLIFTELAQGARPEVVEAVYTDGRSGEAVVVGDGESHWITAPSLLYTAQSVLAQI